MTQHPKLLDGELLSQFDTFLVLRLADERGWSILRSTAKQSLSSLGAGIQTLMPGEGRLMNLTAPFAVPTKIGAYADVSWATEPPLPPRPVARPNVAALVE